MQCGSTRPRPSRPTGQLQTITAEELTSPASASPPYVYTLSFQNTSGLIPSQRFTVPAASLATVTDRFDSAVPAANNTLGWDGLYPIQQTDDNVLPLNASINPAFPSRATLYFNSNPSLVWNTFLSNETTAPNGEIFSILQSNVRRYSAGEQVTDDWNSAIEHPAPDVSGAPDLNVLNPGTSSGLVVASATRAGNEFTMQVAPFSDAAPGQYGT